MISPSRLVLNGVARSHTGGEAARHQQNRSQTLSRRFLSLLLCLWSAPPLFPCALNVLGFELGNMAARAPTRLVDLAPEVVALIAHFSASSKVIALWLSGDVRLRSILSVQGGVQSMRLTDMTSGSTSRWPMCLASFKGLLHLHVSRPHGGIGPPSLIWQELKKLPRLLSLEIDCIDDEEIFTNSDRKLYPLADFWPYLSSWRISGRRASHNQHGIPLDGGDRNLRQRAQGAIEANRTLLPVLAYDDLQLLPLTLTSLSIAIHMETRSMPHLPQTLQTLRLTSLDESAFFLPHLLQPGLPDGLITISIDSVARFGASEMREIPRTVTRLEIVSLFSGVGHQRYNAPGVQAQLNMQDDDDDLDENQNDSRQDILQNLPEGLKNFAWKSECSMA